jgi:hypothetical protein
LYFLLPLDPLRETLGFPTKTMYSLFIQSMHAIRCAHLTVFNFGPQIIFGEVPTALYNFRSRLFLSLLAHK